MPKRNPHRVVYGSSYDRGLWYACEIWPNVVKELGYDDLEFVAFYGWESFDAVHKNNPEKMKWKWELIRKAHKAGVKLMGRVTHEQLAEEFKKSGVWFYPTGFEEIDCITAKKTQASGCTPITTGYGALQVSVVDDEKDWGDAIYHEDNKAVKEDLTKRLISALRNPESEEVRAKRAKIVVDKYCWDKVAEQWLANLK